MTEKIRIKSTPFELIMCPYCGARLNRFSKQQLLPTSCISCEKHNIIVKIMMVVEVEERK